MVTIFTFFYFFKGFFCHHYCHANNLKASHNRPLCASYSLLPSFISLFSFSCFFIPSHFPLPFPILNVICLICNQICDNLSSMPCVSCKCRVHHSNKKNCSGLTNSILNLSVFSHHPLPPTLLRFFLFYVFHLPVF